MDLLVEWPSELLNGLDFLMATNVPSWRMADGGTSTRTSCSLKILQVGDLGLVPQLCCEHTGNELALKIICEKHPQELFLNPNSIYLNSKASIF